MNTLTKKQNHAFGKDIYLLGVDSNNENVWLEAPSWDCGWYWGFGYVERYTNNKNPQNARDITSHTHIDSEFKKDGVIDVNKGLERTTFTKDEGIRLNALFTEFYQLKDTKSENANKILIPNITKEIIEILTK